MDKTSLIGTMAAILTTVAFIPQVIKAHVSKETKDLSLVMYALFVAGLSLWIVYGVLLFSLPIIIANCVVLVFSIYLLYLKLKFG